MKQENNLGARVVTVTQFGKTLELAPETVRKWIAQRRINFVRLNGRAIRIPMTEIERLIEDGLVPARHAPLSA